MSALDGDDLTLGATPAGPPAPGVLFAGRYLIERALGRGGMGIVYAALDRTLGETVALKLLSAAAASEDALERFRREVRLARKVTHHNVARTFDIGEHEGTHYLTMELVHGHALDGVLARGALAPATVARTAAQICAGLAAAHAVGIVHRDLKPANVLVEDGGRVVLTDFGIAHAGTDPRLTGDGALLGTLAYMAPEQISGRPVDGRADIYALGLMLFQMTTGVTPFPADSPLASALARLDAAPPDPRAVAAVPDALAELTMRCLQADPGRRPADAQQLAQALVELSGTLSGGPVAPSKMPTLGVPSRAETSASSTSFVSATRPEQGLAVLPLQYRGPADDAYIADALTDELIDVLSMTKGLRVPARGATNRFADDRDPKRIGAELGVGACLDGTVQRMGSKIRIGVRLVDTSTEVQTWSEHYTGELDDVFEFQERMTRRIAETLRVELDAMAHRGSASAEAIELYFRARRQGNYRNFDQGDDAVSLFERCLALAPDFAPAVAGHALACVVAWFLPGLQRRRPWSELSRVAVERALERAPELPETHYAAARYATQLGDYALAARRLARALELAPTYAEAHEYLGTLQLEGGRAREGVAHVMLAHELDPTLWSGRIILARHRALHGDMARFEETLARLKSEFPQASVPITILELRVSMWIGDRERARQTAQRFKRFDSSSMGDADLLEGVYLGGRSLEEIEAWVAQARLDNPRFLSVLNQILTEAMCVRDRLDKAMEHLRRANETNLVDLDWLDHCAAIAPLRETEGFEAVRDDVVRRAQAIWTR